MISFCIRGQSLQKVKQSETLESILLKSWRNDAQQFCDAGALCSRLEEQLPKLEIHQEKQKIENLWIRKQWTETLPASQRVWRESLPTIGSTSGETRTKSFLKSGTASFKGSQTAA